jgi:hypothetical protein
MTRQNSVIPVDVFALMNFNAEGGFIGGKPRYETLNYLITVNHEAGFIFVKRPDGFRKLPLHTPIKIGSNAEISDILLDRAKFAAGQYLSGRHGTLSYELGDGICQWFYTQQSNRATYLGTEFVREGKVTGLTGDNATLHAGYIGVEHEGKQQAHPAVKIVLDMSQAF